MWKQEKQNRLTFNIGRSTCIDCIPAFWWIFNEPLFYNLFLLHSYCRYIFFLMHFPFQATGLDMYLYKRPDHIKAQRIALLDSTSSRALYITNWLDPLAGYLFICCLLNVGEPLKVSPNYYNMFSKKKYCIGFYKKKYGAH